MMNWTQTGWMGHDGGGWIWGMGLHGLFGIFFSIALIFAVIALARYLWRGDASSQSRTYGSGTALTVLEARYAKGEIERDEFLQRKQDLS